MRIRLVAPIAFAALAALACEPGSDLTPDQTGRSQQPILGGDVSGPADDPAVVALANTFGPFCTGTLVTPRAVLTAAHCIDQFDPSNPQLGIFFGSDSSAGGRVSVVGGATRPGWDGQVGPDKPNDIGLLILSQSQDPALPLPMNLRAPEQGENYRHVGFGVFDNNMPSDGRKREGTVTISAVGAGIISSGTAELSICFGDSGGPGFVVNDGVEHVAGVHSFTSTENGGCRAPAGDARVDAAMDWIQPWLDDNDPTCGPDGVCAEGGCSNDPDCASCGADGVCAVCATPDPDCPSKPTGSPCQQNQECMGGTCVTWDGDFTSKFCSETCGSDGDCPSDMECRTFSSEPLCYVKSNPDGRLGASCDTGDECFSNQCDDGECVIDCNIALGFTCPNEFTCTGTGDGDFFCRGDGGGDDGGCRTSQGNGPGSLLLVLMALGYLARRRL